jgi:cytochrome c oxidase subunit 2
MSARTFPRATIAASAAVLATTGCASLPAALAPAGIQSERIAREWWIYFTVTLVFYLIVIAGVLAAVLRRRRHIPPHAGPAAPERPDDRRLARAVLVLVVAATLGLVGLYAVENHVRHRLESLRGTEQLVVEVTGHQWWWEFRYLDPTAANIVTTATELHVPVGRPVRLDLRSADVIHSLWIPQLHGKADLVPGHPVRMDLRVDRAGTFDGACAEFCGHQHATMRLVVVAEPAAQFAQWLQRQRLPGAPPATGQQRRGQQVFLSATCVMCHTVAGTGASSEVGPDLTHVGGRRRIASGTLVNEQEHLARWIADPQAFRPGVRMPPHPFAPADLEALAAYLENLK